MSGELFMSMAGLDMTHVPYKGSAVAHPDLRGGITSHDVRHRRGGSAAAKGRRVRPLAVTTAKRARSRRTCPR